MHPVPACVELLRTTYSARLTAYLAGVATVTVVLGWEAGTA